jgi:plastocyanin
VAASPGAGSTTKSGSSLKVSTTPQYGAPSASAPVLGGTVQIAYRNITIQPDVLRVKVGTTLRWTNYDTVEHNVTSESGPARFASRTFGEGQAFQVTLTKPGIYHYECTIHPTTMNGTIEVVR